MRHTYKRILAVLLVAVMMFTGCGGPSDAGYKQVNAQEAQAMMSEASEYIILDVRTPEEYEEEHIKGAVNVPNESIGDEEIETLPDKTQQIFVYCRSGNRSKQAAKKLVDAGYTNIIEFGGIKDWNGATETGA